MSARKPRRPTVVITGIASRLGRLLTRALHQDHRIIGLDERGARHMPKDVTVHTLDLRRKKAEDIFRRNRIDAVVHLAPITDTAAGERRLRTVVGTHKLLDYCRLHDVPKVIVVSSTTVYGASHDNDQFLHEESPLMAGPRYPSVRDLVEIDMFTQSFFWQHPEIDTVLLRPVHLLGRLGNPVSRYLGLRTVPTILGFDPMVQVMAPEDFVDAIRRALKPGIRGVFNIAGPAPLPLSALVRRLGHRNLPVPEPLIRMTIGLLAGVGVSDVPSAELDYLKFVCMVDDSRARDVLRFVPRLTIDQTLEPLR